jgi:hypothetical protein
MIGEKFTRLTVVSYSHKDSNHRKWWNCVCDCGNLKVLHTGNLRSGNTKSCGCFAKDSAKNRALPNHGGVINHIILQYKRHAKQRGFEFELTKEFVSEIIFKPCFYCGVVGGNLKKTKNFKEGLKHNGIDRIDSSLNYTIDNVVPCCGRCNIGKSNMKKDDFLDWVSRIFNHQQAMASQWGSNLT